MGLELGDPIPGVGRSVGDELLEPTRIYVKPVLALIREVRVRAMAHITGGGITENLPRVLPAQRRARIDPRAWPLPPIFAAIQRAGRGGRRRDAAHLQHGDRLSCSWSRPRTRRAATRLLEALGERVYPIGEIVPGAPGVDYV